MERIGRNSGVKLLSASPLKWRGLFLVFPTVCLFVRTQQQTLINLCFFRPLSSINGHFQHSFSLVLAPFRRRAPISRESGSFSFSKLFFSTNHCTARGIFSLNLLPFLCLRSDLHEIRNLSFFRRAACNRGVIS